MTARGSFVLSRLCLSSFDEVGMKIIAVYTPRNKRFLRSVSHSAVIKVSFNRIGDWGHSYRGYRPSGGFSVPRDRLPPYSHRSLKSLNSTSFILIEMNYFSTHFVDRLDCGMVDPIVHLGVYPRICDYL
ncbi:hypothetical protein TNCV_2523221 [Trichonephila clavipes]|nr:hypothetical protein TNCV_2523221 [Trichonephila clavipes]